MITPFFKYDRDLKKITLMGVFAFLFVRDNKYIICNIKNAINFVPKT